MASIQGGQGSETSRSCGYLTISWNAGRSTESPNLADFAPARHAWYRETLTELLDFLAAGEIKPAVAARIPLVEAARAHELIERGGYAGKVDLVSST